MMTRITAILVAPDSVGLQDIYGMPSARRLIVLLRNAGIDRIDVLGDDSRLRNALSDLLPATAFHPWDSARLPEEYRDSPGRFLILRADLVFDRNALDRALDEADKSGPVYMKSAEEDPAGGLYLTGPETVMPILQMLWFSRDSRAGIPEGFRVISGPAGLPCCAGRGEKPNRRAEDRLAEALAGSSTDDGFMARWLDRRISRFVSRRLAHTAISPNRITITGMSIGLLGAFFLYLPSYWARLFGAFLFVACVIVDGIDGEVARLKLMESRFGHLLDIVTDNIVHVAIFVGIGLGLYHRTANPFYPAALLLLIGGFGLSAVTVYVCILRRGPGDIRPEAPAMRLMTLLASRDFAYLVLLFAAIDRLGWFLAATSVGIYLFDALLWILYRLEIRHRHIDLPTPANMKNELP